MVRIKLLATIYLVVASGNRLWSGEPALQEILKQVRAYEKRTAQLEMTHR